ncbi:MAG: acyltransferase [Bacteroidales bacterium]|nr:acyltransferase [Bacteroidales bacterium]
MPDTQLTVQVSMTSTISYPMSPRTSAVISALRFPLILLVIWVHATVWTHIPVADPLQERVFHFVTDLFSFNLGRVAVCVFFVLSGYLFFWSADPDQVGLQWFLKQWKKRVRTLLVPYLIWNLIMIAAVAGKSLLLYKTGLKDDGGLAVLQSSTVWDWLWFRPANLPLWYVRDLMCLTLCTPLLYFIFRHLKWLSCILLVVSYFLPFYFAVPGFRVESVYFFTAGAWLGMFKKDLVTLCRKITWPSYILSAITLFVATCYTSSPHHDVLLKYFLICFVPAAVNLTDTVLSCNRVNNLLLRLSRYVFFIYAVHVVHILGWTKAGMIRLLGHSLFADYAAFFLTPFVVCALCILLYRLLERIVPRFLAISVGNRTINRDKQSFSHEHDAK